MKKDVLKIEIPLWNIIKIIALVVLFYLLFLIKDILVILIISFIFAATFEPVVDRFESKFHLPRWVGISLIYISIALIFYLFFSMVFPILKDQLSALLANWNQYIDRLESMASSLPGAYGARLRDALSSLPNELSSFQVGGIFRSLFGFVTGVAGLFVVLVISFYILSLKNGMNKTLSAFVPERRRDLFIKIFSKITKKISHWFGGQLILSFVIGVITFVGLWIMNIPYPLILAIFAAITELIPLVGPWIGAVPAVLVAFFISPVMALIVAIFYLFVQQLENHILVPQIMKKAVGLNPIVVILVLLIGARLLGVLGVLIAVPVTSAINVIIKEWPRKERENGN